MFWDTKQIAKIRSTVLGNIHTNHVRLITVMCRLTTGLTTAEDCVVRQFHHCTNTIECTCTILDGIVYYTSTLYGPNLMGPPWYTWSVTDWNVLMQCMTVWPKLLTEDSNVSGACVFLYFQFSLTKNPDHTRTISASASLPSIFLLTNHLVHQNQTISQGPL